MNDQTTKLLEQLASKLGTTSQYLWGVLLKQAPIDATISLIQTAIILLMGWGLWKVHKNLMNDDASISYSQQGEAVGIPMILATILWAVFFIAAFLCAGEIVYGYFNPEYWALHKVLENAL